MTRHLSQDSQTDELMSQVAATAMSSRRSEVVRVNAMGFVRYVALSNEARQWDSVTLNKRCRAVAAVAHDRWLANHGVSDGTLPTLEAVAAAERALNF